MSAHYLNFIAGEFVPSFEGKSLQMRTSEVVDSGLMDVVRSVQAANKALLTWSKTTPAERFALLRRLADLVESHASNFAHAVHEDLGTLESSTLTYSIPETAALLRAHYPVASALGIVGVITPASDPLTCLASRFAPAIANGNALIAKVSRYTPATGSLFARLAHEAGFPAGVFALLQGRGAEVGESLLRHPAISTISFLGSSAIGREVALIGAQEFKKMHLSLGAKNPALVFANTDLSVVIPQLARLCLGEHPSQSLRVQRVFIQESIFKPALELLKTEFANSRVQAPLKPEQQIEFTKAVALAEKENGKVQSSSGAYLFADLTNCSTLQQDEIPGTLILAGSFKYQHEALKHANVSPYGRVGYIFENDLDKAKKVAEKFEVGSIFINTANPSFDPLEIIPLFKSSGFAPEGGTALATFYSRVSSVHIPHD